MFSNSKLMITALLMALLGVGCSNDNNSPPASTAAGTTDVNAILTAASTAMGMQNLDSITYSGSAWRIRNSFMQTPNASPPWPYRDTITNYQRSIDLQQPASRASGDTFAQNLFLAPAVAGTYTQNIPAGQTDWRQQMEIWLTPWGFLKGAQDNGAEASTQVVDGSSYTVLTWLSPANQTSPSGMQYTVKGYLNEQNLVDRVETWVEDPFLGDMNVVAVYSDYQDFNGLMVPTTMEQQRGGGGIFGVSVTSAAANPPNVAELLTFPASPGGPGAGGSPAAGAAAPPSELAQKLDDGVYLITGGYVALAVEFSDHIVVFEGGQSETRGRQVIDEVKRVIPNKPIRYVVNSHPHSDHTAGLVPFVRERATIITHANNVDFLNMALSTPRTLLGEARLNPTFEGVDDVKVLEDAGMRFELHHVPNGHTDGMLVGFLPAQKILFQADFTLPQPGAEANPFVVELAQFVDSTGLDFERYLAVHAAQEPQTKADLMAVIGK
ncbi:MAG: MBL fold metallo-hydrolase [Pseudomonadales bacterium]|nr:MBL fold metallo-hydrolase [Pseudomonadales bacterium]